MLDPRLQELLEEAQGINFHHGEEAVQSWFSQLPVEDKNLITEYFMTVQQIADEVYHHVIFMQREVFLANYEDTLICIECGYANIPDDLLALNHYCHMCGAEFRIAERIAHWLASPIVRSGGRSTEESRSALTVLHAN